MNVFFFFFHFSHNFLLLISSKENELIYYWLLMICYPVSEFSLPQVRFIRRGFLAPDNERMPRAHT
jgi:hypothetical protein